MILVRRSKQFWLILKLPSGKKRRKRIKQLKKHCSVRNLKNQQIQVVSASKSKKSASCWQIIRSCGRDTRTWSKKLRCSREWQGKCKRKKDWTNKVCMKQASYSGPRCSSLDKAYCSARWNPLRRESARMKNWAIASSLWSRRSNTTSGSSKRSLSRRPKRGVRCASSSDRS